MSVLIPIGLAAGVAYLVYSQRKPPAAACAVLTPQERNVVNYTLQTSDRDLLMVGVSHGASQAMVVQAVNELATATAARGCPEDAQHLRDKASSIARHAPAAPFPFPQMQAAHSPFLFPAPQQQPVQQPPVVDPMMGQPPVVDPMQMGMQGQMQQGQMQGMDPMQMGMQGGGTGHWGGGLDPLMTAQRPQPIALMKTNARTFVRPEPRAWDDSQGRFGFSVPAGFPVAIVALPPQVPPGWTKVALQHPDHGAVEGFVEGKFLSPANAPLAAPAGAPGASVKPAAAKPGATDMTGYFKVRTGKKAKARPAAAKT